MIMRLIAIVFLIDTWLLASLFVPSINLNPLATDWTAPATYVALLLGALVMVGVAAMTLTVLWWRNR